MGGKSLEYHKLSQKAARFSPVPSVGSSNPCSHAIIKPVIMSFHELFHPQIIVSACPIRVPENPKQSQTTTKNPKKFQKDRGREA